MKYSKEERIEVGRKIHESGLSNLKAGELFGICDESARKYRLMYEKSQGIERAPRQSRSIAINAEMLITPGEPLSSSDDYSSMSRAGTPTDNGAMESINSWIKAEIFTDLHITDNADIQNDVSQYIKFFNEERPAYSLNYLTPKQFKEQYEQV